MKIGTVVIFKTGQPAVVVDTEEFTIYGKTITNNKLLETHKLNNPENQMEFGFYLTDSEINLNKA
jgi:hypothetical protein